MASPLSASTLDQPADLKAVVRDALRRAEAHHSRCRPWDARLSIISIVCGALATVLAGGAVAGGKPALDALGGWKILCSIVAVLTASATAASSLHKSMRVSDRVANAEKCIARLRALDAALVTGGLPPDEALKLFQRIAEDHAVCLA